MTKGEIIEVLKIQIEEMNNRGGKDLKTRLGEIRACITMLAQLVLESEILNRDKC